MKKFTFFSDGRNKAKQGAGYAYFLKKGFQTYLAIMILTL